MSVFESIIYGLVSGLTEFLPVSSRAHQALTRYLFGIASRDPLQDLLVHIGVLLAILAACKDSLFRLRRQQKVNATKRRKVRSLDGKSLYELRLLKTAAIPLVIGLLFSFVTTSWDSNLLALFSFLIVNAVILLFAEHSSHGNRDARMMSGLDGIIMGIIGALSVFPGISRTGAISSYAISRGADSQNTATWSVLVGIPALIFALCFDFWGVFAIGVASFSFKLILGYVLSGIAAWGGAYIGISFFQVTINRSGFSGFAYYSLGAALFSFVLYLIT